MAFEVQRSRRTLRTTGLHQEIKQQFLVDEPNPLVVYQAKGMTESVLVGFLVFNIHEAEQCEFNSQGQTASVAPTSKMTLAPSTRA